MEKLQGTSMDIVQDNIEKLKEIFPEIFTEGKIDFEVLKQLLGEKIETDNERYSFTWKGKTEARQIAQEVSSGTLRPEQNVLNSTHTHTHTGNLYIEGDNLEVLKLLQKSYHGKIKMIYIDPPYNTGKDFIYPDNYKDGINNYLKITGQLGEEGQKLTTNIETDGSYHSKWLNMIYPRLKLARNLLTDDGVIFISIDDNEVENLKKLCNEIFGEENYINMISLFTKVSAGASGGGEDRKLKKNIEYILFYAKNLSSLGALPSIYKKTNMIDYIEQMKKDGKSFKYTNVLYKCENKEYYKTIKDGNGGDINIFKVKDYEIKTVKQISKEENLSEKEVYNKYYDKIMTTTNAQTSIRDRVWEATDSENNMYIASYTPISGKNKGKVVDLIFMGKQKVLVIWLKDTADFEDGELFKKEKIGTYWDGFSWINVTKEGDVKFENGKKPIALIQRLIQLVSNNEDMYVLDFFSGSATTAHAVMQLNAEDKGKRKFIMVQLPENLEDLLKNTKEKEAKKSIEESINFLQEIDKPLVICEIGKERIRRAGEKIKRELEKENSQLKLGVEPKELPDIGFKVFKLDSSNIKEWDPETDDLKQTLLDSIDNIKSDRNSLDVLYEIILKYGLELTVPIEENEHFYSIGGGTLLINLDKKIDMEVIDSICEEYRNLLEIDEDFKTTVVLRDSAFKNDVDKTNAMKKLEQVGIKEVRSI